MKIKLFIVLLFIYNLSFSQESSTSDEIILWINNFENSNSVERIMQGTLEDKLHLEYKDGYLFICSMLYKMGGQPDYIRGVLKINDIVRIEAVKKYNGDNIIVTFQICSKKDSIVMECKDSKDSYYSKCDWYDDEMYEKFGFCSSELRFKFPISSANDEIERVYKALKELVILNGGNPRVGSLF
jgi:hypothetical protein